MDHIKVPLREVLEYHEFVESDCRKGRCGDFLPGLVGNIAHEVGDFRNLVAAEFAPLLVA